MHGALLVEVDLEILALDVAGLSAGIGPRETGFQAVAVILRLGAEIVQCLFQIGDHAVGMMHVEGFMHPGIGGEDTVDGDDALLPYLVGLVGGPAVVVVPVLGAFGIPGMLGGELVEQVKDLLLHALPHSLIHFKGHLLDIEGGKLVIRHFVYGLMETLRQSGGQAADEFFVVEEGLPIFQAHGAQVLVQVEAVNIVVIANGEGEDGGFVEAVIGVELAGHVGAELAVVLHQLQSGGDLRLIEPDRLLDIVPGDQSFQLRVGHFLGVHGFFHALPYIGLAILRGRDVDADDGNVHPCGALRVGHGVLHVFDLRIILLELLRQGQTLRGAGVPKGLRVQQTDHVSPADLLHGDRLQQMGRAGSEGGIHEYQLIVFCGAVGEEIVVDDADVFRVWKGVVGVLKALVLRFQTVDLVGVCVIGIIAGVFPRIAGGVHIVIGFVFSFRPKVILDDAAEVGVDLAHVDAVVSGVVVAVGIPLAEEGFDQVSLAAGGLQDVGAEVEIDALQHLLRQGRGRWIELIGALGDGHFLGTEHFSVLLSFIRR